MGFGMVGYLPIINGNNLPSFLTSSHPETLANKNDTRLRIFSGSANPSLSQAITGDSIRLKFEKVKFSLDESLRRVEGIVPEAIGCQFVDPYDAAEAQYHMNSQNFGGREITVVLAAETGKRPEEMRTRTRGPRGFAFVQFVDLYDAAEAQYHLNRQDFGGREITVVLTAETRKRPEEMRTRTRKVLQEHGITQGALDVLSQFIGVSSSEIQVVDVA